MKPALKEWASVIDALLAGEQIVLVRKGGIADRRFGIEAEEFFLYPTYLHQQEKKFKPEFVRHVRSAADEPDQVVIAAYAQVAEVFRVIDRTQLDAVLPFVIFTGETLEERSNFRSDQAVHVIALRVFRLAAAFEIDARPEYRGCRSWIDIEVPAGVDVDSPVLDDAVFSARLARLRQALTSVAPVSQD